LAISAELRDKIQALFPWMSEQLLNVYSDEWTDSSSDALAIQAVRQSDAYQLQFAGNYDPATGLVRIGESDYMAQKAAFDATLVSMNLNPQYFADDFVTALENEVSPREFIGRMESAYERIIQNSDAVKQYYADNYGIEMTDSAILASAINPSIGDAILQRQISIAEIGGAAAQRGFDVGIDFSSMLAEEGVNQQQAGQFFSQAADLIPMMNVLQARNADPDDPFDLNDVTSALLFDDPETRRQIRRNTAQESARFTGGVSEYARSQTTGGVAGLAQT